MNASSPHRVPGRLKLRLGRLVIVAVGKEGHVHLRAEPHEMVGCTDAGVVFAIFGRLKDPILLWAEGKRHALLEQERQHVHGDPAADEMGGCRRGEMLVTENPQ